MAVDSHTSMTPLSSATTSSTQQQQQPPQQQQHSITTTKMGSRRIFSAQFKLQVLESYRMDSDCKGNQRATARKYGIHRRQIQKWLQCETTLRSCVVLNNNNSSTSNNNSNNNNSKITTMSNGNKRLHENINGNKSMINQTSSIPITTTTATIASTQPINNMNSTNSLNKLSMDVPRQNTATIIQHNGSTNGNGYVPSVNHQSSNNFVPNSHSTIFNHQSASLRIVPPSFLMQSAPSIAEQRTTLSPTHSSGGFTPYTRPQSMLHYRELPLIPTPINSYESAFHHHHHHSTSMYGFYEHPAYRLYPSAYMPSAIPLQSQSTTELNVSLAETQDIKPQIGSPVDLTIPVRSTIDSQYVNKPRAFLPAEPKPIKAHDITPRIKTEIDDEQKPWDLSRKRCHSNDDIDEGISENIDKSSTTGNASSTSPKPAKVVKLFKPYLLSSDEDDEIMNAGKKCITSDSSPEQTTQSWSNRPFYDSPMKDTFPPASFQSPSPLETTTPTHTSTSSSSSYWLNHGSPVSGYDSASSTFSACSDCNCNDPVCATKLPSPAPTVASVFSDDFNPPTEEKPTTTTTTARTATKYIVPRRIILEKWTHEENDSFSQQYQRQRLLLVG